MQPPLSWDTRTCVHAPGALAGGGHEGGGAPAVSCRALPGSKGRLPLDLVKRRVCVPAPAVQHALIPSSGTPCETKHGFDWACCLH